MLNSLVLRNFQTHKKLKIDFAEGVTSIVGSTNCGKSAVIRALIWILRNKPTGKAFITHGETSSRARITIADLKVSRWRDKDENCYILGDETLRAMGADVPDAVLRALQIADASIQQQHDSPYMLGLSPRGLAEEINRITGCEEVDAVLDTSRLFLREAKATTKIRQTDLTKATQALAETQATERLEMELAECQRLANKADEIGSACEDLADVIHELAELRMPDAVEFDSEAAASLAEQIKATFAFVAGCESLVAKLRSIVIPAEPQCPPQVDIAVDRLKDTQKTINSLTGMVGALQDLEMQQTEAEAKLGELEAAFSEMQSKACPLCGR